MKKALCAAAALMIMLTLLFASGCGENKNSEIVGEWVPATANINGETIKFSELNTDNNNFGFVFEENGSCEVTIAGTKNNGSYVFNDTSVDIEYGGKTERLAYSDGMLTLYFNYNNESTSFMFTKKTE